MSFIQAIKASIEQQINRSSQRSSKAIKHVIASFAIKMVSIVAQFMLIPITMSYVSQEEYGIWLTLSSIVAWLAFFDIGFGSGLRNRITEAMVDNDTAAIRRYVSTTYISLSAFFFVLWGIFIVVNLWIDWSVVLKTSASLSRELSTVAAIVVSTFCLQIVLKLISIILLADQKPAHAALLETLGQLVTLVVIYILICTTQGSLTKLAWALSLSPLAVFIIASAVLFRGKYREFAPRLSLFDKKVAKDMLLLGGKFFVLQIANIIIYQTISLIISHTAGNAQVPVFHASWKYFLAMSMVSTILTTPLWSASADAYKRGDFIWLRNAYRKLFKIAGLLSLGTLLMLLVSPWIYDFWLRGKIHIPIEVSIVIALTTIFGHYVVILVNILNGIGRLRLQLCLVVIGILLNIPLAYVLGEKLGLWGVLLPMLGYNILSFVVYTIQVRKIIDRTDSGIWYKD